MTPHAQARAKDKITALAAAGLDLVTFWRESGEVITPLVPHYMGLCWYTLDPASLLITSHYNEFMPELPHDSLALEYYEDDVHNLADVARSPRGVSTLHEARAATRAGAPGGGRTSRSAATRS